MDSPSAASLHYTGLDGLWKSAAFWGVVGAVCQAFTRVPSVVLAMVIGAGLVAGSLCAWWLSKLQTRWINPTRLAAVGLVIGGMIAFGPRVSALGALAMGSFLSASINLSFLLLGRVAVGRLNREHGRLLEAFGVLPIPPPPLEKDAVSTREAFLAALPPSLRGEVAATFVPAIVIDPGEVTEALPAEASSFGGLPALEPGSDWPSRDGRPMDFLARINLVEVADFLPTGSPTTGLLSFFYDPEHPWGGDPEDKGSGSIRYSPNPQDCLPLETGRPASARQSIRFRRQTVQSIPGELEDRFYAHYRSLDAKEKARLDILHERALEPLSFQNRLVAPPGSAQNDMAAELQTASRAYGLPAETTWIMLLQLDSVSEQGWCWGDAGCLYFWIPEEDWYAARFDRPWVILQCS